MVQHQQLSDALVADAVLAGQDQRVREELLADRADQLPLDVLDRDLVMEARLLKTASQTSLNCTFTFTVFAPGTTSTTTTTTSVILKCTQTGEEEDRSHHRQGYSCL